MTAHGKEERRDLHPLPTDFGAAIADYLFKGRPPSGEPGRYSQLRSRRSGHGDIQADAALARRKSRTISTVEEVSALV